MSIALIGVLIQTQIPGLLQQDCVDFYNHLFAPSMPF
jgi:hypothetical protein